MSNTLCQVVREFEVKLKSFFFLWLIYVHSLQLSIFVQYLNRVILLKIIKSMCCKNL